MGKEGRDPEVAGRVIITIARLPLIGHGGLPSVSLITHHSMKTSGCSHFADVETEAQQGKEHSRPFSGRARI